MANEIWNALFLAVCFLGIAAISYFLILRVLKPRKRTKLLLVLPFSQADGDVTEELYAQHIRLQILGLRGQSSLIALDAGMNDAQRQDCIKFCRSVEDMYYCSAQELPKLLERLQEER